MGSFNGFLRLRCFFRHQSWKLDMLVTYFRMEQFRWTARRTSPCTSPGSSLKGKMCSLLNQRIYVTWLRDWCLKKRLNLRNPLKHPIAIPKLVFSLKNEKTHHNHFPPYNSCVKQVCKQTWFKITLAQFWKHFGVLGPAIKQNLTFVLEKVKLLKKCPPLVYSIPRSWLLQKIE